MTFKVENMEFGYRSKSIITDISFEVEEGDILTILGPNGVGKTTLLKCINRILKMRSGSVDVDGISISSMDIREMAKIIGYVPQRVHVSGSTVFESVLLGRKPHLSWDISQKDLILTSRVIEAIGLSDISEKEINTISGGEYQLVQIARAIVQQPKVILLDEPTNNLDISNQNHILNVLTAIVKENNMCAVMTNHDINLSLRHSDKFIFMKAGEIYAAGGIEIVVPDVIKAVYGVDVDIEVVRGHTIVIPK